MTKPIIINDKYVTDRDLGVLDEYIALTDIMIRETRLSLLKQKTSCLEVIAYEHGEECAELESCMRTHCVADCDECSDTSESCFIVAERNGGICTSCDELCENEEDLCCFYGENLRIEISELEYRRDSLIRVRDLLDALKGAGR